MIFTNIQTVLCCDMCGGSKTEDGIEFSVSRNRSYDETDVIELKKLFEDREKFKKLPDGWERFNNIIMCPFCAKAFKVIPPETERTNDS